MTGTTGRMWSFAKEAGPTVIVLALLAGVGVWGHRTGWKASAFPGLRGGASSPEKEDWCETHNVPLSRCIACHPELAGSDPKDWCKEHGVPESKCTACHPELLTKGKADDWCAEHGVPESQCTLCHPEIAVMGTPPADESGATVVSDPASPADANPSLCRTHLLRVQFASAGAVRKAGVGLGAVEERPMALRLTVNGETDYDQTRVARVSVKVPGTAWRILRQVGDPVRKGDVLALVDAVEVGRAKAEFIQALAAIDVKSRALDRIRDSAKEGFRTRAEQQEAEASLREARLLQFNSQQVLANLGLDAGAEDIAGLGDRELTERMRFLGLPEAAVKSLDPGTTTANLLPVTAPLDGVVISREVVAGEAVDPARPLFVVADLRRMWVLLDVRQEDAGLVEAGQAASFRTDASADDAVSGRVTWVGTAADERTRTVQVRVEVENPGGRLRARTFGTGRIVVRETAKAVVVPDGAVQWEGCCHIVFVRLGDEIFQTRKVRIGVRSGGFTEILAGVLPGEVVVTEGSHVLKADILRSKLGAGCCDE